MIGERPVGGWMVGQGWGWGKGSGQRTSDKCCRVGCCPGCWGPGKEYLGL